MTWSYFLIPFRTLPVVWGKLVFPGERNHPNLGDDFERLFCRGALSWRRRWASIKWDTVDSSKAYWGWAFAQWWGLVTIARWPLEVWTLFKRENLGPGTWWVRGLWLVFFGETYSCRNGKCTSWAKHVLSVAWSYFLTFPGSIQHAKGKLSWIYGTIATAPQMKA
jgi:hypothetical protein